MAKTDLLYQKNVYQQRCDATVLQVLPVEEGYGVVLDQTVCFPEGGGQPSDFGTLIGYGAITHVGEIDGQIVHQVTPLHAASPDQTASPPEPGQAVTVELDWPRRFSHMQRHCGEHVLSAVFYDLFGGINRGFHMGQDYMTIDIRLEENPDITALTDEDMLTAEWEANRMVWDNLPVTVRRFQTREEAAAQPMRKALAIDEDIVLVAVGDPADPAGCVACCGTHPSTTGQIGLIKLYKWENYKGMYRITFDAGDSALKTVREQSAVLRELGRRYSADFSTLPDKLATAEEKNQAVRKDLYELKKIYTEERARQLVLSYMKHIGLPAGSDNAEAAGSIPAPQADAALPAGDSLQANTSPPSDTSPPCLLVEEYEILGIDDLTAIGRALPPELPVLAALISGSETAVFLKSNGTPDCHKLVRDNAPAWNGKGGGRPDAARAVFNRREDLECFIDYLTANYPICRK